MKTAILYSTLHRPLDAHNWPSPDYSVMGKHHVDGTRSVIYIRLEVVDCHYSDGLDYVKPRDGETFLNCVPLDEQVTA